MINRNELKAMIVRRGLSIEELSKAVGINRVSLSKRINNKCEFKVNEILRLQKVLHLSNEDRDYIFFNDDVNSSHTYS